MNPQQSRCKNCENHGIAIKARGFDYGVKIDICKKLIEQTHEPVDVWNDLKAAVWDLYCTHNNNGFIVFDGIKINRPGELFPEEIKTNACIVWLPKDL
jgi:hypothetical protein